MTGREQDIESFLYSGLEGVRRDGGRAAGSDSRNKRQKVSLERAAVSSRPITAWVRTKEQPQKEQERVEPNKMSENVIPV